MKVTIQNLRKMWSTKWAVIFFMAVLIFFPVIIHDTYLHHIIILSLIYSILTLSWNFISGYTGIFTFGHQGFYGMGAYVSALLALKAGVSPWLGLVIGGIIPTILGIIICLPCLRLRAAPYIVLVTLGLAEIAQILCKNLVSFTRGELGLWGIPPLSNLKIGSFIIDFSGVSRIPYYYVILIIFLITVIVLYRLINSPTGFALKAIRDSREAAESLGIPITRYKLLAFIISSFFAGLVGAFYAHYMVILTPTSVFHIGIMVEIMAITIIGGFGTFIGPIAGSFLVIIGLEYLRVFAEYRLIIYGVLLIITIIFIPEGITKLSLRRKKSRVIVE